MSIADFYQTASFTNVSRSSSITVFDENLHPLKLEDYQIEFFIPRDPTLPLPPFQSQNITATEHAFHYRFINLKHLDRRLNYSVHLEMMPDDDDLSYLLLYKFNAKALFTSIDTIDGWTFFCASSQSFLSLTI